MLIDHHTHTASFSFDGRQTMAELLQAVRDRGLDGFCLTEHYEKDVSYIAGQEAVFNLDDYYHFCMALQDKVSPTDPVILYGIELGYLPHLDECYARLALRYPFDAIIMSLHILDGEDPYVDKQIYRRGRKQVYGRYLEQLTEMIGSVRILTSSVILTISAAMPTGRTAKSPGRNSLTVLMSCFGR